MCRIGSVSAMLALLSPKLDAIAPTPIFALWYRPQIATSVAATTTERLLVIDIFAVALTDDAFFHEHGTRLIVLRALADHFRRGVVATIHFLDLLRGPM